MRAITWRKSTKPANRTMKEDQWASQPGELGGSMTGLELVQEPESSSKFRWEGAKEAEPRAIWVWDRNKQTWVEAMEKPSLEEPSRADGSTTRGPIVPRQPSATPASVTQKVRWPRSAWKLLATRPSVIPVSDARALKSKAPEPSGAEAAVRERTERETTSIIYEARQEPGELPIVTTGTIEEVQDALSKANDKAIETKEKVEREAPIAKQEDRESSLDRIAGLEWQGQSIVKAVGAKAEAKAEDIIARAEEEARVRAEEIIAQVGAKAEAEAGDIIARAEERARVRAEEIIEQVGAKAEAEGGDIIARAEERARVRAEGIIAQVGEKAEAKAEDIIARAEEEARARAEGIIAQVGAKAEAKAEDIIARAEERARARGEEIIAQVGEKAEAKAEDVITRAVEETRARAEGIIAQVEEKAKEQAETTAAEAKAAYQETVSAARNQAQRILRTAEGEAEGIKAPAETTARAVPEQLAPRQEERDRKERPAPYEGTAELVIGPPINLGRMQKVLNYLQKFDQIRILDLEGSVGKGISVKLFSRNLARLPDILVALPEVEKVSDMPRRVSKITCPSQRICPGLGRGNEPPARRLLVTMERRTTYLKI